MSSNFTVIKNKLSITKVLLLLAISISYGNSMNILFDSDLDNSFNNLINLEEDNNLLPALYQSDLENYFNNEYFYNEDDNHFWFGSNTNVINNNHFDNDNNDITKNNNDLLIDNNQKQENIINKVLPDNNNQINNELLIQYSNKQVKNNNTDSLNNNNKINNKFNIIKDNNSLLVNNNNNLLLNNNNSNVNKTFLGNKRSLPSGTKSKIKVLSETDENTFIDAYLNPLVEQYNDKKNTLKVKDKIRKQITRLIGKFWSSKHEKSELKKKNINELLKTDEVKQFMNKVIQTAKEKNATIKYPNIGSKS